MHNNPVGTNGVYLAHLISERCGTEQYLSKMCISADHLERLLTGSEPFRQSDMIRTAAILKLSNDDFMRCFFSL